MVMDRETWHAAVHGAAKRLDVTEWLNNNNAYRVLYYPWCQVSTGRFGIYTPMNKGALLYVVWRRPWHPTPVLLPGKSQYGGAWEAAVHGALRVGQDWVTSLSLFTFMHWRRKWQPTPVFLPGESQGRGSLVGCRLWGRRESDTT